LFPISGEPHAGQFIRDILYFGVRFSIARY
jgi:hypothetical protein